MFGRSSIILAAVLVLVGTYFFGRYDGAMRCAEAVTQAQREAVKVAILASQREAERLAVEAARETYVLQLEDAARAEPPSATACLPVSRVLRLNQR